MSELILSQSLATSSPFDSIRRFDERGGEFWTARDLMPLLGYRDYKRMEDAVQRAIAACQNAGNVVAEHFRAAMPKTKTTGRPREDYDISRLGCYLVAMNCDPRKPEVAAAQTYFAVKTRQAEIGVASNLEQDAIKDMAFLQEIGKLLEWAGIDPVLIAGHVISQCAERHPTLTGYFEGMKKLIPQQESMQLESVLMTPTEVGQKFDPVLPPRQVNKILLELGLQEKTGEKNPPYKLTELGQSHGKIILNQGSHSAKTVQQVRWLESVIGLIEQHLQAE